MEPAGTQEVPLLAKTRCRVCVWYPFGSVAADGGGGRAVCVLAGQGCRVQSVRSPRCCSESPGSRNFSFNLASKFGGLGREGSGFCWKGRS